jgi:chromodomain-helicase-DNA-binding protein 7
MYRQYKYEKIDGTIKSKERQNAIDRFNNPEKKRDVFLLSTKAGGLGINLTSANIVIIFDSDWNPQNDVQATARAHRIGQQLEVQVYRLITARTYEAEMFERASKKLGLDQAIFMGGAFQNANNEGREPGKGEDGKEDPAIVSHSNSILSRCSTCIFCFLTPQIS